MFKIQLCVCVHVCCEDADQVPPSAGLYDDEMQCYMDSENAVSWRS